MNISDFPLLTNALRNVVGPDGQPYEKRSERLSNALPQVVNTLSQALEDDCIPNKTFVDTKDHLRAMFEYGYKAHVHMTPALSALYDLPWGDKVRDLLDGTYGSYPEPHTLAGKIKKIEKLPQSDATEAGLAFFREIAPLANAIQALKGKTVKRQVLTDEERRARKFTAPVATTRSQQIVRDILEQTVSESYDRLLQQLNNRYQTIYETFLKDQAEADLDPTKNGFGRISKQPNTYYSIQHHCTFEHNGKKVIDQGEMHILSMCFRGEYNNGGYRLVPVKDVANVLANEAKKNADEIRNLFVTKNLKKIVSILEAKGDDLFLNAEVIKHTLSLQGLEGEIIFTFVDGSSFRVTNKVVWVMNSYGTQFYRFPLTFHDVVMPDGSTMKSPSEARMNSVFLGK